MTNHTNCNICGKGLMYWVTINGLDVCEECIDKAKNRPVGVIVRNLATGQTLSYSCSAREAVVAAYEQSRNNNNTWQYAKFEDHPEATEGKNTVACGDFCCYKKESPMFHKAMETYKRL